MPVRTLLKTAHIDGVRFAVEPISMDPYIRPLEDLSAQYTPYTLHRATYAVDYDVPDALNRAIAESGIRFRDLEIGLGDIPVGGQGQRKICVEECFVGIGVRAHEITRQVLIGKHCVFCPPLAAVRYPRVSRPGMTDLLVTVFTRRLDGSLYQVAIGNYEGGLGIKVVKTPPDFVFPDDTSFLIIDRNKQPKE